MKIVLALLFLILLFGIFHSSQFNTNRYVSEQAKEICQWINGTGDQINFRVGPQAFDHLKEFRGDKGTYTCELTDYKHKFGYQNEASIKVLGDNRALYLIYGFGQQRLAFSPRYYQHASDINFKHR